MSRLCERNSPGKCELQQNNRVQNPIDFSFANTDCLLYGMANDHVYQ